MPSFFSRPQYVSFEQKGVLDAKSIIDFAHTNKNIRILVNPITEMPQGDYKKLLLGSSEALTQTVKELNEFQTARFNMNSTGATPAPRGYFPGDDAPELWTQNIFAQSKFPICISFRYSDSGPDLANIYINKQKEEIEGIYREPRSDLDLIIKAFIDRIPTKTYEQECSSFVTAAS